MDSVVESALAGDLGVPEIGCSRCGELEVELAKAGRELTRAAEIIRGQAQLLGIAEDFIKSYEAENANRETRRAASRKRSKAGLVAVAGEPTPIAPVQ